ncbi:uncharacterized protein LOC133392067 [Anopheles gambiae]|uniref:Uncharacterized protein n=1 Tax=Anopheles gambiae TaxID=7165 RepID=A0A0E4G8Q4_ANOGA|nr:uncharacterized protein LOC133392067 [Anopheles gambiae]
MREDVELCLRMANAVEQNIIYNKKSPHHKNRDRQNDAWMCVAEEVGLTMAEAKKNVAQHAGHISVIPIQSAPEHADQVSLRRSLSPAMASLGGFVVYERCVGGR